MPYCFISDLHLQEDRPDITQAFLSFLEETASKADKLYILGDLFEAWIGDDDQNDFISEIQKALIKINKTTEFIFIKKNIINKQITMDDSFWQTFRPFFFNFF